MSYQVVYFSRTGNSKRVAERIAKKLSVNAIEITDNMNWKGIIGFIKGGYYASINKNVEINVPSNIDKDKELIVVSPLWASKTVPAINTFLQSIKKDKVYLIVTSGSGYLKNRIGYKSVIDIIIKNKDEDAIVDDFINRINN